MIGKGSHVGDNSNTARIAEELEYHEGELYDHVRDINNFTYKKIPRV